MRFYVDVCCLNRPFDDQRHARVRLESEAVLSILSAKEKFEFVHSAAHDLENTRNPHSYRASRIRAWLDELPLIQVPEEKLLQRINELMKLGFKNFDAFHLAASELAMADVFLTCDDRLLSRARKNETGIQVRVLGPIEFAAEVL